MSLIVECGPMTSGKTKKCLSRFSHLLDIFPNKKSLIITSKYDTRGLELSDDNMEIYHLNEKNENYNKLITSHSSLFNGIPSKTTSIVRTFKLNDVNISKYDIIFIDEGQFFEDLYENVNLWVNYDEKYVIVAALDTNFERERFGNVHKLLPISNKFTKNEANCMYCIEELGENVNIESLPSASFTARLNNITSEISPGGLGEYVATCRKHHPFSKEISEKIAEDYYNPQEQCYFR